MILKCDNLSKNFGERELFSGLSFSLEKKDTLAIVGRNGCGKSTLLKIIAGLIESDTGSVSKPEDIRVAYLAQTITGDLEDKRSGGERTKAALKEVFDKKPQILILDEPTNHLDMESIEALQERLLSFSGAIILVSHDRYLINKCANQILDLNTIPCKLYKCSYTEYLEQKEIIAKTNERAIKKAQDKIRHEKQVIEKLKSFNREKSIKRAESREKSLSKIEVPDAFVDRATRMNIHLTPAIPSGKDVIMVSGVKKSFDDRVLLNNISLDLRAGEHVGIIGKNGCGKTTLFNIILGNLSMDEGSVKLGANVEVGYYDQRLMGVDESLSLFEQVQSVFRDMNDTEVRNTLAAFSFYEDDVYKKVSSLSGGERGRLSLLMLMLSSSNFLLLDEPTNHLDMESNEILEDAINSYTGTVLFISHDRFFLNKCADRIIEIEDGEGRNYLGNYDDYLLKKSELLDKGIISATLPQKEEQKTTESDSRLKWEEEKRKKALEEKRKRDEAKLMQSIEYIEEQIENLNEEMSNPAIASDHVKLALLMETKTGLDNELSELYEQLENLMD